MFPEGVNKAEYFWQMRVAKEKIMNNDILNSARQNETGLCDSEKECRQLFIFCVLLNDNYRYAVFCCNAGTKV